MAMSGVGCSSCTREDDGTEPVAKELPALELRDDTADLLLTWVDEKGEYRVEQHPADVPANGRDAVRVVIAKDGFEGDGAMVYVADLRTKLADGGYPVRSLPRSEWELVAQKRRDKTMLATAPPAPASGSAASSAASPTTVSPTSRLQVIVYGAEWCGACHEATRYLRRRGIDVVEKDIEQDDHARREMQEKLAGARIRSKGSIPVIDVRGQILVGFDQRAVDRAIRGATEGEPI